MDKCLDRISYPRPPTRSPGAGRSWITSRRKRKSAAGRPPVAVEVSPVGEYDFGKGQGFGVKFNAGAGVRYYF
jgi:hypothetical protein